MIVKDKLYTVQDFEHFLDQPENADRRLELIYGEIVEKDMTTQKHGIIALNIGSAIKVYLKQNPIGRAGVEISHRNPHDDYNTRLPDVAFTADLSLDVIDKGSVPQMPDLAVEVKSPGNSMPYLRQKADYYLQNGSRLVWIVNPEKDEVEVWSRGADGSLQSQILGLDDSLDGATVLPNFSLSVKDVFDLS